MKNFLRALCSVLVAIAGLSFLFGGGLIHALVGMDRLLAEILGIGIAFVCLIGGGISMHLIDDIEWKEANEEAGVLENERKP